MVRSMRTLNRLVIGGLSVWVVMLIIFFPEEQLSPAHRWHRKDFRRISQDGLRRSRRAQHGRIHAGQFPPRKHHTIIGGDENATLQWEEDENENTTIAVPKPKRGSRIHPRRSSKTTGWFSRSRHGYQDNSKFNAARNEVKLPLPIIVMGFPKAGTSSLFAFFQRQGFASQHWYCCKAQHSPQKGGPELMAGCMMKNLRHNKTNIFDGCGHNHLEVFSEINGPRRKKHHPFTGKIGYLQDDGTVDYSGLGNRIFLPQHFQIEEVHEAYPEATWILNWRDIDSWIESVMKWGDDLHNQFFNEYYMQGAIKEIPPAKNLTHVKIILAEIYREHYNMVRRFVLNNPSHALVEVNITDDNAGNVLGEAFGLDPRAWSNVNRNKKRDRWKAERQIRMYIDFDVTHGQFGWFLFVGATAYLGWYLGLELSY